jgi:heterodisulfide reductase subunit D
VFNLEQEIKDTKVRLCLDCGKCTVVCPVSQYDSDFNPRLIIQKRLGRKDSDVRDKSIWSCFNCQMCNERCNYKVKFPEFITSLRTEAVQEGERIQCSHGGALQSAMHMMAKNNLKQSRLDWLPKDILLTPQSETIFFVGCAPYFDVIFEDLGVKTLDGVLGALRLLNRANIPFNLLSDERCCGRDLLIQGDRKGFINLVQANTAEFNKQGIKKIITYCPECYACLKLEYPKVNGNDGIEVTNLYDLITPLIENKKIVLRSFEKTVTYQDPCTLGRGFRMFEAPRKLLGAIPKLNMVEMANNREQSLCCGANPWAYCNSVNRQVQMERLAQANDLGVDILITACPKCQIHLKCAQKCDEIKAPQIEIQDLASLVSRSLTGGV